MRSNLQYCPNPVSTSGSLETWSMSLKIEETAKKNIQVLWLIYYSTSLAKNSVTLTSLSAWLSLPAELSIPFPPVIYFCIQPVLITHVSYCRGFKKSIQCVGVLPALTSLINFQSRLEIYLTICRNMLSILFILENLHASGRFFFFLSWRIPDI